MGSHLEPDHKDGREEQDDGCCNLVAWILSALLSTQQERGRIAKKIGRPRRNRSSNSQKGD